MNPGEPLLDHKERLRNVDPVLVAFCLRVPQVLGGWWRVGRGATTDAEQLELWRRGREVPGENCTPERPMGHTVTEAKSASQTAHGVRQHGACGVDLVAMNPDGTCDWGPKRYEAMGELVRTFGFDWGGDFEVKKAGGGTYEMRDLGHIQIAGWRGIPLRSKGAGNV